MINGPPLVTFRIPEPYPAALRKVRKGFTQEGLRIPIELDVTSRIKQELGAGLAPCMVVYVDDPALLLEAVIFHRDAALAIPQPVVIAGHDRHTEVLVRSPEALLAGGLPLSTRGPLLKLHGRIVRAMETVAEREEASVTAVG
jgi:uncharacterized protein (DUF302 family)